MRPTARTNRLSVAALVAGILGVAALMAHTPAAARPPTADADIRQMMLAYNDALNGGRTEAVLPLYTRDAIFMPPYSESAIGIEAVKKAYDQVFQELTFNVKFTIREVVLMSPSYAYVRTNSVGTTHHASTGQTTSEANQELFILRKDSDGAWKIARYSFSPTNPPSRS